MTEERWSTPTSGGLTRAGHAAMLITTALLWGINTARAWTIITRELRALNDTEEDRA